MGLFYLYHIAGEKIGVEYLYSQTGKHWQTVQLDPDKPDDLAEDTLEDEGFEEMGPVADDDPTISLSLPGSKEQPTPTSSNSPHGKEDE